MKYEVKEHKRSIVITINSLKGIQKRLELYTEPSDFQEASANKETSDSSARTFGDKVFIVHGRDDESRYQVALFVKELGLNDIMLDRQPDEGIIAILDKFEREAKKQILLSPC